MTTTASTTNPFAHLATDDPRHVLGRAVVTAASTIDAVRDDQLHLPTPCEEKDVLELVGHIVPVVQRIAVVGRAGNIMEVTPQVEGTLDELRAGFAERAADLPDAWSDDARLGQAVTFTWAATDGAGALAMYTAELTVHTWDLATATGQRPTWDADAVASALRIMQEMLPAEGRTEGYQAVVASLPPGTPVGGQPFGEAVAVPDGAPLIDQLVGWTGRDPARAA
jgi:uncharacterized protein (TIGR03086 family)